MPSKNTTTVVLTEKAQPVKDDLAPIFGLKNILSAGLILFGKLTDAEQKEAIAEANTHKTPSSSKEALHKAMKMLKEIAEVERQQPGTIYRVLSADEQHVLDDFYNSVKPETHKHGKQTKVS